MPQDGEMDAIETGYLVPKKPILVVGAPNEADVKLLFLRLPVTVEVSFCESVPEDVFTADRRILLVCEADPCDGITRLIEKGSTPTEALDAWCVETRSTLAVYRKLWRKATLVSDQALAAGDPEVENVLSRRLGLPNFAARIRGREVGLKSHRRHLTLRRYLVSSLIAARPSAQALVKELEAAMIGVDRLRNERFEDCVEALAELAELTARDDSPQQATQDAKEEVVALRRERNLLREVLAVNVGNTSDGTQHSGQVVDLQARLRLMEEERDALRQALQRQIDIEASSIRKSDNEPTAQADRANKAEGEGDNKTGKHLSLSGGAGDKVLSLSSGADLPADFSICEDWTTSILAGQAGKLLGKLVVSNGEAGHVFFGPYKTVFPGRYAIELLLTGSNKFWIKGKQCNLEIVAGSTILKEAKVNAGRGAKRLIIPFFLSPLVGKAQLEVRLFSPGGVDLTVDRVRLLKLNGTLVSAGP